MTVAEVRDLLRVDSEPVVAMWPDYLRFVAWAGLAVLLVPSLIGTVGAGIWAVLGLTTR